MRILDFSIDYEKHPLGVEESPLFCWKIDEPQTAYALRVTLGDDTVYDSGLVRSGQTVGIFYEGKPLLSDCRYTVNLCVYGANGEMAQSQSYFDTGLLREEDWQGRWVEIPSNFTGGALLARKDLVNMPRKKITRAKCFVAGLGYHELYINGRKITDALLSPAISDWGKRVYYIAYDITDDLGAENNVLGVMLGNGWFGKKTFRLQLNVHFVDGTVYTTYTGDGMWWAKDCEITENSVYGGEVCDARKRLDGWATAQVSPSWENGWMYWMRSIMPPTGKLVCQSIEPISVCGTYQPIKAVKTENGATVYDLGQNIAGRCKIRVRGNAGAKVTLFHGENVKENGEVNRLNLRLATNRDVYILRGDEEEEYAPRFTYHGFRFVQAETEGNVEILSLVGEHVHTDVRNSGEFRCSNETLNTLHRMAVMTESNNLHGIMTDCPQRDERFMWLNDLSSRIFQTVYNFGMERFFPKVLADISDTSDNDGCIADTAPFYVGMRPADPVCVCYLLFALRSYEWYGNKRIVEKHYDKLKAWTEYLLSNSDGYIMQYFYYADWVLPFPDTEGNSDCLVVSSAYLYWHLICMQKLAKIAGKHADEIWYTEHIKAAKKAFNARFYNTEKKCYAHNTQTENAIAISLKLAPEEDREEIGKNILADIKRMRYHSTCGNQGYRHLFYAMSELGYTDEMIEVITNPEYPGWGYMVECGATTVWERWEKEMQCEMHSFDHPMFGSYDGWMYEYLGGIRLDEEAFGADKLVIAPHIAKGIAFVESSIDTIRGKVVSRWEKINESIVYEFTIPQGTVAEVNVVGMEKQTLTAGDYRFTVKSTGGQNE